MPTLSETMTLVVFSARVTAGTLNVGQIYSISDKGWVLQAHSNTVAKPIHGALRINNGDLIPEGIDSDELKIDLGVLGSEDTEVQIMAPNGYKPIGGTYDDTVGVDDIIEVFLGINGANTSILNGTYGLAPAKKYFVHQEPNVGANYQLTNSTIFLAAASGCGGRVVIWLKKYSD